MKNKIKILSLALIFAFSLFLQMDFSPIQTFGSSKSFEQYSNEYKKLINDNPYCDYDIVSLDIDQDTTQINGTYMIDSEKFAQITDSNVTISPSSYVSINKDDKTLVLENNENVIQIDDTNYKTITTSAKVTDSYAQIPLEDTANQLGYSIKYHENSIDLYREYQTKRLIIKSKSKLDRCGAIRYAEGYDDIHIYQYTTEEETIEAYNYYSSLPEVNYVEVDSIVTVEDINSNENNETSQTFEYSTWGAEAMGVDKYSEYIQSSYNIGNLPEIIIAVVDTGLDSSHSWFEGRIADGGTSYSPSNTTWEDDHGHGTHVSGIIVDMTFSNVKILPIKVLNSKGIGSQSQIEQAIEYIIQLKNDGQNIKAINLSLGSSTAIGSPYHTSYSEKINSAYDEGILSIVAAGNDGDNVSKTAPANIESAITVGAIDSDYNIASFSNFGQYVDVCAPGVAIISARKGDNGGTITYNGTSMATPHISAIVALLYTDDNQSYSVEDIEKSLDRNIIDLGSDGWDPYYGNGLVNIEYAYTQEISEVNFNKDEGEVEPFELTLTADEGTQIYYTLDGTTPTYTNGTLYTNSIVISKTTRVKAIAYKFEASEIVAFSKIKTMVYIVDGEDIDNAYTIDENGTITSYIGVLTNVTIPNEINGIEAKSIGKYAFTYSKVVSVVAPSTLTTIDKYAFSECSTLKSITATGVEKIGMLAFQNCTNLEKLTDDNFPALKTIDKYAFWGCNNIDTISLSNCQLVEDCAFYMDDKENTKLTSITLPNVQIIGNYAFYNCTNLSTLDLSSVEIICNYTFATCQISKALSLPNIRYIGSYSFAYNSNITNISMPKVQIIGSSAFAYCTNLVDVTMKNVQTICDNSFANCTNLSALNLPEVVDIKNSAFYNCSISNLSIPKIRHIGRSAFQNNKLIEVNLPNVISIEKDAFDNNLNLYTLKFSNNIEVLEDIISGTTLDTIRENLSLHIYHNTTAETYAKQNNLIYTYLDDTNKDFSYTVDGENVTITSYNSNNSIVTIPSYLNGYPVTKIGDSAFKDCSTIEYITSNQLKEIGNNAFENCINLKSLYMPNAETIGDNAFANCTKLNDISIINVKSLGTKAFLNCTELAKVEFSKQIKTIGEKALGYNQTSIISDFDILGYSNTVAETYATENNISFHSAISPLSHFYYTTNSEKTEIYISYVDTYITGKISIPSSYNDMSITKISDEAFEGCNLITEIYLPKTITTIGSDAFKNCTNLENINLENITKLEDCDYGTFYNCISLKSVYAPLLKNIPDNAFVNCENLEQVNIPNVTIIGQNAFYNCHQLSKINCENVEIINSYAFAHNNNLKTVNTPKVKILGTLNDDESYDSHVFEDTNLQSLYLPNIQIIGSDSFPNSIKRIVIGDKLDTFCDNKFPTNVIVYGYTGTQAEIITSQTNTQFEAIDLFELVTDLPTQMEITQYEDVKLSILVNGYDMSYQWYETTDTYENGTPINNANSNTFTIDSSEDGTKMYFCIITNWDNEIIKTSICNVTILDGDTLTISVQVEGVGGTISETGNATVNRGDKKDYTFTLETGYHIESIIIDDIPLTAKEISNAVKNGYTFENITKSHSLVVTFALDTFTISATANNYGTISPAGNVIVEYGKSKTFTYTPNTGFVIDKIYIDNVSLDSIEDLQSNYTFEDITANHKIHVTFTKIKFTITTSTIGYGSITHGGNASTSVTVGYGDNIDFKITPSTGYKIKDVKINNISMGVISEYSFSKVSSNQTISAEFEIKKFKIEITTNGKGKLESTSTLENIPYGETRTFEIKPEEGWKLSKILINGENIDLPSKNLIINSLDRNTKIEVTFEEEKSIVGLETFIIIIGITIILFILIIWAIKAIRRYKNRPIERIVVKTTYLNTDKLNEKPITSYEKPHQVPDDNDKKKK